jgi:glucosamine--fructose-6-phosphate aminotransferase (isomerizing)
MCGIIGYIGDENATERILYGLQKLEYRGYDSAGIAVIENGKITRFRSKGRLENLKDKIKGKKIDGTTENPRKRTRIRIRTAPAK